MKTSVTINGRTIETTGGNDITVINGRVIVDGVDVTPDEKEISITVYGTVKSVNLDRGKILVTDGVGKIKTASGDVEVRGDVSGDVTTMSGDVTCLYVDGNVSTMSGDVKNHNTKKKYST